MSILITGNKGFIGSGLRGDGIDIKTGTDIRTYRAKKKYDVVIHTAALTSVPDSMENPAEYWSVNVDGTINMLRQHPEAHFIYLSTAGVYGEGSKHSILSPARPSSVYTMTKYVGELMIRKYADRLTILRLTNVIGPGSLKREPNVYQAFKKAKVLDIYGDGEQTRDFVDVRFVRQVIQICAKHKKTGLCNVGSGIQKTINEVAKEFKKPIRHWATRPGDIKHFGLEPGGIGNITQS